MGTVKYVINGLIELIHYLKPLFGLHFNEFFLENVWIKNNKNFKFIFSIILFKNNWLKMMKEKNALN